jgi:Zn-dependent protease with chaperone function
MNELVYPRERILGAITLVLGALFWLALIGAVLTIGVGALGTALLVLALSFVMYLFAQSALVAHIKGNGVELSEAQFPDLHTQFVACCERLQIQKRPQAFVLNGNGGLNAFATKFLGRQYVVLMSDIVDAMDKHVDGVRFYLGHELGHLRMKHLSITHLIRWPVLWLPLLGAAYSRARESTCDRHGAACSGSREGAAQALVALSAGAKRWQQINVTSYLEQARKSSGFWMSFHELTAGYPWLTKRTARVMNPDAPAARRNGFAYVFAAFIPYAGRMGATFGLITLVYIVWVMYFMALPAYRSQMVTVKLNAAVINTQSARDALGNYYLSTREVPESLEKLHIPAQQADGTRLSYDSDLMTLTVDTNQGQLVFIPASVDRNHFVWRCTNGDGVKLAQLPQSCKEMGE